MKSLILLVALTYTYAVFGAGVDLKKSELKWKGTKVSGEHVGKIGLKSADIKLDKKGIIKSGNFIADINTITVTDLQGEWAGKFLGHIKSKDFFEVSKYPTAKLVITSATKDKAKGKLTIKGKTNPVEFSYKKVGDQLKGLLKFDRTKFDMIYGSGNFFKNLGDKMIHNEVTLNFALKLK